MFYLLGVVVGILAVFLTFLVTYSERHSQSSRGGFLVVAIWTLVLLSALYMQPWIKFSVSLPALETSIEQCSE